LYWLLQRYKRLFKQEEIEDMKRFSSFAFVIPVVMIFAGVFSPRLEAQRNPDRQNRNQVCFYTDENFRGESFCANLGERVRNLGERFNDRASSIRIFGRADVTVFEDENFGGPRRTYDRDIANLREWNDRITSFQVSGGDRSGERGDERGGRIGNERRDREPRNGACFYVNENFGGQSFCLNRGENERNVGGRFNDRITSIRISGRARVVIFADQSFRGRSQEVNRDVPNLRFFNDRITSIVVK
jgi:hypothetical protein